jgi:hypothetical protein
MANENESRYLTFAVSKIVPYGFMLSSNLMEREWLWNSGLLSLKGVSTRHFCVQVRVKSNFHTTE